MPQSAQPKFMFGSLNGSQSVLQRLFALRVLVLASFVVYVASFTLYNSVELYLGGIVLASAVFSFCSWRLDVNAKLASNTQFFVQLLWDCLIILLFVWVAGRSTNPFIYYYLLVVAISANLLPERFSWGFAALGISAYSALIYLDLGHHMAHMDASFKSHLLGMWINFSGSALLIAFFISRLSAALRRQEDALRLAREENLKNEQLVGIGTIAASTVHSFGTPLSTILMTSSELEALHSDEQTRSCTSLINAQVARCQETMKKLTTLTSKKSVTDQRITIHELKAELEEHLYLMNSNPMPKISVSDDLGEQSLAGGILLLHAIINLVDNAVEAAESHVAIIVASGELGEGVQIVIEDDGRGIHLDASTSLNTAGSSDRKGLGIGLLLVNSTIEKLGGTVTFTNPTDDSPYTRIVVELPIAN